MTCIVFTHSYYFNYIFHEKKKKPICDGSCIVILYISTPRRRRHRTVFSTQINIQQKFEIHYLYC